MPSVVLSLNSLTPHPANARRGDLAVIAESLTTHGQFAPVITDLAGTILAGHHVVEAARSLGWTKIAVHQVDVDEVTARKILVADNRTSDLATYDSTTLLDLLRDLPDLVGTGFDLDELAALEAGEDPSPSTAAPREDDENGTEKIRVGSFSFLVEQDSYDAWEAGLLAQAGTPKAARRVVRARLLLPEPVRTPKVRHDPASTPSPPTSVVVETALIDDLIPYPGNPRHGDVGAISASLAEFGQYRPLVVTDDNIILKGNHTALAAKALGWTHVLVNRVTVDADTAAKIVLVDNRSSDLATYDDDRLRTLVKSLGSFTGTGLDGDDVDDLLAGGSGRPSRAPRSTTVSMGQVTFMVARHDFRVWATDLRPDGEHLDIAQRLDLPLDACHIIGA